MARRVDLTGQTINWFDVSGPAPVRNGRTYWDCTCVCGKPRVVETYKLRSGHTQSCGCKRAGESREPGSDNGVTAARESWTAMRERCKNPNRPNYQHYGGRGIKVCDRWDTFDNFLSDMGPRPAGQTLDRVDPDGDYEPSNCRWADRLTQNRNRRAPVRRRPSGRLSPEKVRELRRRISAGETQVAVAADLGITTSTVYGVLNGLIWKQVS